VSSASRGRDRWVGSSSSGVRRRRGCWDNGVSSAGGNDNRRDDWVASSDGNDSRRHDGVHRVFSANGDSWDSLGDGDCGAGLLSSRRVVRRGSSEESSGDGEESHFCGWLGGLGLVGWRRVVCL
jgi:hypothetical protein